MRCALIERNTRLDYFRKMVCAADLARDTSREAMNVAPPLMGREVFPIKETLSHLTLRIAHYLFEPSASGTCRPTRRSLCYTRLECGLEFSCMRRWCAVTDVGVGSILCQAKDILLTSCDRLEHSDGTHLFRLGGTTAGLDASVRQQGEIHRRQPLEMVQRLDGEGEELDISRAEEHESVRFGLPLGYGDGIADGSSWELPCARMVVCLVWPVAECGESAEALREAKILGSSDLVADKFWAQTRFLADRVLWSRTCA